MWWKCDIQFCRTILQLKVWARDELEARRKIERMYQVATIQRLTPSGCAEATSLPVLGASLGQGN
jgi:hypothetical protein